MSTPSKTPAYTGMVFKNNVLQTLATEYTELRVRASELMMKKPEAPWAMKNWTNHLDNVFNEGKKTLQQIFAGASKNNNCNKDYGVSLAEVATQMKYKLQIPGSEVITLTRNLKGPNSLDSFLVQKFWNEKMATFISMLLGWIEEAIFKVATEISEEKARDFFVQDILDQGKDLLWGIYA